MLGRRPVVVFLLVATLGACALSARLAVTAGEQPGATTPTNGATLSRETWLGLDSAVVRLKVGDRRPVGGEHRVPHEDLVLLAVLAIVATASSRVLRRSVTVKSLVRARLAWWSPISGRAPPPFQPAVS
jgi:hypothetical protein